MITWDERKRRENIRKHRIDLADLEPVFDYPMITVEDTRERYGELRLQSLGMWRGRVVFLIWTPRDDLTAHSAAKSSSVRRGCRSRLRTSP